jgi:hypothetical protein
MRRLSHPLDPVGHAIAAGEELIEAIHWLQADGPMEAAAVAWAARKCLLHLDPGNLDDSSMRTRLYELQAEVYKVTRGSGGCDRAGARDYAAFLGFFFLEPS